MKEHNSEVVTTGIKKKVVRTSAIIPNECLK